MAKPNLDRNSRAPIYPLGFLHEYIADRKKAIKIVQDNSITITDWYSYRLSNR
jgi:hypothetical protein